jgi:hypothetical protein
MWQSRSLIFKRLECFEGEIHSPQVSKHLLYFCCLCTKIRIFPPKNFKPSFFKYLHKEIKQSVDLSAHSQPVKWRRECRTPEPVPASPQRTLWRTSSITTFRYFDNRRRSFLWLRLRAIGVEILVLFVFCRRQTFCFNIWIVAGDSYLPCSQVPEWHKQFHHPPTESNF